MAVVPACNRLSLQTDVWRSYLVADVWRSYLVAVVPACNRLSLQTDVWICKGENKQTYGGCSVSGCNLVADVWRSYLVADVWRLQSGCSLVADRLQLLCSRATGARRPHKARPEARQGRRRAPQCGGGLASVCQASVFLSKIVSFDYQHLTIPVRLPPLDANQDRNRNLLVFSRFNEGTTSRFAFCRRKYGCKIVLCR